MTRPEQADGDERRGSSPQRLTLAEVELVGGGRTVSFRPGLNIIQGDITTGKTTFVRLIRAMLGTVPRDLAPEVSYVKALRGRLSLGMREWQVYRPRTTTSTALVEITEENPRQNHEPVSLRLPAAGAERSYGLFLLDQLRIPSVSVPQARSQPTGALTPVTMTDWLGYCIVTGDELDTQVFGHQRDWRNLKRRWVFELAYGYYDPELAILNASLRQVELQLEALDQDAGVEARFLAGTPFASIETIDMQLEERQAALDAVEARRRQIAKDVAVEIPGVEDLRRRLMATRERMATLADGVSRLATQIQNLNDLHQQLSTQSARLTRAIVADEWLVDFDFVVCPRCGNDIDAKRADPDTCYLCLQHPEPAPSRTDMLGEQSRVTVQISETAAVIEDRRTAMKEQQEEMIELDRQIPALRVALDTLTGVFISDRASFVERQAADQASIEAEIVRLNEYRTLLTRHRESLQSREALEARREQLTASIHGRELGQTDAEENVRALEDRMLGYLQELHIPDLGLELSVKINRTTYLPEVSGRTFDELSSQGLKTLVNIAHALAHHTVAIDRGLPLPGLLVLDGLSANAGHEGFDQDRVEDVYRLLSTVAADYEDALQVIAVDNELPRRILLDHSDRVVLTLTQSDRLIRMPRDDAT